MGIVFAKESAAVQHGDGAPIVIPRGTAYDDSHDIVKRHPDLFEVEPSRVAGRPTVERATRAPGQRSNARDPQTAAQKKAAANEKRKATLAAKKAAEAKSDGAG